MKKKALTSLVLLVVLGFLAGCKSVEPPSPVSEPEIAETPNIKSANSHLEAVGMLPQPITYAQAYWTRDNRIFVMGVPVFSEKGWAYYHQKRLSIVNKTDSPTINGIKDYQAILPIYDPTSGKSSPLHTFHYYRKPNYYMRGLQLADGKVLFLQRHSDSIGHEKQYITQELVDPVQGVTRALPVVTLFPEVYTAPVVPMPDNTMLYVAWDVPMRDLTRKSLSAKYYSYNSLGPTFKELFASYPAQVGSIALSRKKDSLYIVAGSCFDSSQEAALLSNIKRRDKILLLNKCNLVRQIDLRNGKTKIVGHLTGISSNVDRARNTVDLRTLTHRGIPKISVIDDNRILVVAGEDGTGELRHGHDSVELINVRTHKGKIVGSIPGILQGETIEHVLRLSDGSVVVLGDYLYLFDQKSEKFKKLDRLIVPRSQYGSVVSPNDKVYILGGYTHRGDPRIVEMFDYKKYKNL